MTCCFFLVENTPGGVLEARFEDGGLAPRSALCHGAPR